MENQSCHTDQPGMADQGFRPFTSLLLSTPNMAQQHTSSSVNVATTQMQTLPSACGTVSPTYDGYNWLKYGEHTIPVSGCQVIYYKCAQVNCGVKKSVELSEDYQIVEIVYKGKHNHLRPSNRWPGYGPAGIGTGSEDYMLPDVSATGTLMHRPGQQDGQLPSSSESEEDDDSEARANEEFAGDASATERHVAAPGERATKQTKRGNSLRNERRSKSKVWDEFTAVFAGGKIHSAECKHCKKRLSGKSSGGTSHLRRHLKTCPAQPGIDRAQQQQSSSHPDTSVEKHLKLDQDKSLDLLTKALVSNLCSFTLASGTNFRQFMAAICPTYDVVSQGAVREKFIGIFQNEKVKLKKKIALTPGGVFLAVANWGDFKGFICVTVNFIDEEWKLNRKIIKCCYSGNGAYAERHYFSMFPDWKSYLNKVVYGHKEAVTYIIKEAIQDWSFEAKLLGISLPNSVDDPGENIQKLEKNVTGQNYLLAESELLTLPCMINLLHDLIVISGCDRSEFLQETCRYWFEYMTCSAPRTDKYEEILSQLHLNKPSVCSQSWYFMYHLLEAALKFNKAWPNPGQMDSRLYPSKPSCEQLAAAENFCDVARLIYHAVKVISSPCFATLNSYFCPIWNLKIALMGLSRKANIDQVFDVEEMQEKFDKLWRKWYLWLSLAVVLDPRYKIGFLGFCFKLGFGNDARKYILQVRGKMYELFLQYSCYVHQQSCQELNQRNDVLHFDTHDSIPVHGIRQSYIKQSGHEELEELIAYLEGDLIPQNVPFDILKWWKDNASVYPTLARLARDILVIPGSAVSAESAFNAQIDERVSLFNKKMSPDVVEALVCTQDWIKLSEIGDEDGKNRNASA